MTAETIIPPFGRHDAATLPAAARIFVYGAGMAGSRLRTILEMRYCRRIAGFLDSNREGEYDGLPVMQPESLLPADNPDLVIVIASQYWPEISARLEKFTKAKLFNGYYMATDAEELAPVPTPDRHLAGVLPLRVEDADGRGSVLPDAGALEGWLGRTPIAAEPDAGIPEDGAAALHAALRHLLGGDLFFTISALYRWLRADRAEIGLDRTGADGATLRMGISLTPEARYAGLERTAAGAAPASTSTGLFSEAATLALARFDAHAGRLDAARRRLQALETGLPPDPRWAHLRENAGVALEFLERGEAVPPALAHLAGDDPGYLAKRICAQPFKRFDVQPNGDVLVCCHHWLPTRIGNIYLDKTDAILNSPTAHDMRRSMLDGSFKYCNLSHCPIAMTEALDIKHQSPDPWAQQAAATQDLHVEAPHTVVLAMDQTCNLSCPSCRRGMIVEKGMERDAKVAALENAVLPILPNAERLYLNTAGEVFASKASRRILEQINRRDYPKLLVDIISNGILFSPAEWAKFPNIHDMIGFVRISIDAAQKETFERLRRGGDYKILCQNMEFLAGLRRSGVIPYFATSFTYQAGNFREIPAFVDWCRNHAVDYVSFEKLEPLALTPEEFAAKAVHLPEHPSHREFAALLHHPCLRDPIVRIDLPLPEPSSDAGRLKAEAVADGDAATLLPELRALLEESFVEPGGHRLAQTLLTCLQDEKHLASFVSFVITRLLPRDHQSVFWGDRLLTIDKSAGFLEEPRFAEALAAISGSHRYDQFSAPHGVAWRINTLVWAARAALRLPEGDLVECGVFKGDFAWCVARICDISPSGRRFFLYDSFAGLHPTLSNADDYPEAPWHLDFANAEYRIDGLYEQVAARFADMNNVVVRKGYLPEALDQGEVPEKIAFLHIDLNSPTAEVMCLEKLFPKVVPGGIVILDDYGWKLYHRQKEAEDAFFTSLGYQVLELPTGQGMVVKR
ncbi:TylF/MycF/NovP-related O-methyltransferase [Azospirillum sp. TSO5]|uniref:TylF/MycF/NovP-related O-methyltransferase n=1 Tax=Azospirillum sp. TSO5 TaxID=716760 RepID=UPI001304F77D|nr:TylF/MycF/NovP-related O-methyltransferase [Azospirillum sp. TSO5]